MPSALRPILSDILGALTASAVVLPQSMGLGIVLFTLLGQPSAVGAFAGILGAIILSFVSGLSRATVGMISAPNGPVTMLLLSYFALLSQQNYTSAELLFILSLLIIMSGLFQIIFSLLGGTELVKYIPYPVVVGQISAIGFLMIKSQLASLLEPFGEIADISIASIPLLIFALTLLTIIISSKLCKRISPILIGFIAGIGLYLIIDTLYTHARYASWVVGELPSLHFAQFHISLDALKSLDILAIASTALAITLLASMDTLVTAIVADSQTNLKHSSKKELIAQGSAHILVGLFGALGGGGTKGATLVNLQSGGRVYSALFTGLLLLLLVVYLGDMGRYLPIAVLSAVIAYVGYGMINFNMLYWLRYKKSLLDGLVALVVFGVTISIDLVTAVGVGILISMILFFRIQIHSPLVHTSRDGLHRRSLAVRTEEERELLSQKGDMIVMYELRGNIFFATADKLLEESEVHIDAGRILILNFLRVQYIDISGVILLLQIASRIKAKGGELLLCHMHKELGMGKKINKALERIDKAHSMRIRTFVDSDTAFEYAENRLLEAHGISHSDTTNYIHLEANSLCRNMSLSTVEIIRKLAVEHHFHQGEVIFHQGDHAESLYILMQGAAEIRLYTSLTEYKRFAKYVSGTYFGEVSFLSPGPRSATAIATQELIVLELSHAKMLELDLHEKEELSTALLFELGGRLAEEVRVSAQEIRRLEQV